MQFPSADQYSLPILSNKTIQTVATTNTSFSYLFLPFPLPYALSQVLFFLIINLLIYLFYVRIQPLPCKIYITLPLSILPPMFQGSIQIHIYEAS